MATELLSQDEFETRLRSIDLLLLDVDGILTDGGLFYVQGQGWTRVYNVYDGYGIRMIQKLGFPVGVISGGQSDELKERVKMLGLAHVVLGSEDKSRSLDEIVAKTGIPHERICFMGDELFDIPALSRVGLAITVPDAMPEVKAMAHWVTSRKGGHGAVREVIDAIRKVRGLAPDYLPNPQ